MLQAGNILERMGDKMNNQDFKKEVQYWLTMSYIKQLRKNGSVSDEEYKQIDRIILKKHEPILGTLLSYE